MARGRLLLWYALAGVAGSAGVPAQAAELLNSTESRGRMLDTLMQAQAGAAVEEAARTALRTGDWKSYTTALDDILTTYTRGWSQRKQVKAWVDLIRPVTAEPAPWLGGVGTLTPDQKDKAKDVFDRITALPEPLPPVPWLLPPGPRLESPEPKVREALAALREGGRGLMPAWIALLADPSPAQGWAPVVQPSPYQRGEEESTDPWKSLERPVQRREIAESILAGVMPESQVAPWRKFGGPDKAAAAWWGAYHKETDAGLALIYALHGTGPVQERGMALVMAGGDEKAINRLEKDLLGQVRMPSHHYQLTGPREFMALRGRAVEPFLEQVMAALRARLEKEAEQYAETDPEGNYRRRVEDWLKGQESQFRSLLDQRPAGEFDGRFSVRKRSWPPRARGPAPGPAAPAL